MKSRITELLELNINLPGERPGLLMATWQEPFQMLVDSELLVVCLKKW